MAPTAPITESRQPEDTYFRAEELGANLPPLMVAAERIASTVSQGIHGRRQVGQGETFWQFRRYQFGDSVHNIDWRQSGKSQRVYIRQSEWEAAQSVWLWCDNSASMDFASTSDKPKKSERAVLLALALASLLVRGGEYVALSGSGKPPSNNRAALQEMALSLSNGTLSNGPLSSVPPIESLPRDARMVLFGDFLDDPRHLTDTLAQYADKGVKGLVVRLIDPAEEALPYGGRVLFEGMEGDGEVLVEQVDDARETYGERWREHGARISDLVAQAGWGYVVHHTDHSPEEALMHLYLLLSDSHVT
ncbi:MAG: DUF58 domain-containing protein [Rhodospirillales bacterium]|jgi:uncharacterized protein (DUF58 family)|nr:DUF58 domain-containing protein [Rhodospirillales bacterium]MBT4040241.1 DUF58 domain-containing protein [Rhodospirillales bacterium]MBT4625892.1 DUF58 domain-containing protein [Rhodospirillales bacterium]MBT5352328.1 DUF58 domain-containing protein [Rhodospirillales bacterium]MBT5520974.1 DUF58 domain-containing protein [Rhodospirillales bacterium]